MQAYRTSDGSIAATQADAGKGFVSIELPTTKRELIDFINAERATASRFMGEIVEAVTAPPPSREHCPKCSMTEATAREIAEGMTAAAIAERIAEQDGPALDLLVEAVVARLRRMQRKAS